MSFVAHSVTRFTKGKVVSSLICMEFDGNLFNKNIVQFPRKLNLLVRWWIVVVFPFQLHPYWNRWTNQSWSTDLNASELYILPPSPTEISREFLLCCMKRTGVKFSTRNNQHFWHLFSRERTIVTWLKVMSRKEMWGIGHICRCTFVVTTKLHFLQVWNQNTIWPKKVWNQNMIWPKKDFMCVYIGIRWHFVPAKTIEWGSFTVLMRLKAHQKSRNLSQYKQTCKIPLKDLGKSSVQKKGLCFSQ